MGEPIVKHNLIIKAAVAAALAASGASAFAASTSITGATNIYAAEAITSSTTLSVAAGQVVITAGDGAAAGTGFTQGDLITLTLNGGQFSGGTPPSAVAKDASAAVVTNGVTVYQSSSTSVTYQINANLTTGATITLGTFALSNVGSLAAANDCLTTTTKATLSLSGSVATGSAALPTGTSAVVAAAQSCSASVYATPTATNEQVVISTGAKSFKVGAGTASATVAEIGQVTVTRQAARLIADASTSAALASTTYTVSGNFSNISAIEARTNACDAGTATGQITGTISGGSATIAGAFVSGTAYHVCLTANGTGVLNAANNQFKISGSAAYATPVAGTTAMAQASIGQLTYTGTQLGPYAYVFGTSGGFQSFLRVFNSTASSADIYAYVAQDTGVGSFGQLGTLAANTGTLYTAADLNSKTGSTVNGNTDRALVYIFSTGATANGGNIVMSPNNTISTAP